ncbi:carbohydrate ABC transporter substrate-binding protein [Peribacillus psychrosaccharolyticus]|uniref:Carbohydrate ABC transporter substrate-binding protein n=1 Tax=Peribacillus psychrosaccharolyticus TaxID=1407 RepID=A0A974S1V3_PERPY|nr:ABC transporter substrate-binding protein [Peribacillus psychrosaccharolyticus]MEC2057708.1 ABC transporter substrate-binding protein [Peribacillus psychrosaccharolyticus]MED3746398.1 ABC transporter substrate-binding protein [Peribacillus psychrosaccharolyticus]QQT01929.1 carbohydrate ABC transporter substrate-binding protein [Peribacillus psychrosaccharolyticus]
MNRFIKTVICAAAITTFTTGCSSKETSTDESTGDKVTLNLYSTVTSEQDQKTIKNVVKKFEDKYPEIDIKENYPASEYEGMLRVKMAANDMPDLFDTHGWAINRYGEYVEDLSTMDWVKDLDPALDQILKDDTGKVYAYPLNQAKDGLSYNATLLEKYDIKPPETFDEFMEALEMIKEKGKGEVTPLWFAGSDKSAFGQYFDQFATPLLITADGNSYKKELLDGTFDWTHYTYLPEKLKEMQDKKLLNVDVLTAQNQQMADLMAQNKIGFIVGGGVLGPLIEELNPDIKLGVVPMPIIHEGDKQSWIGGERHTFAVWKDSKVKDEAKKFLEFIAQPEIVKEIAEGTSLPAGLTNTESKNYYSDYYEKYKDIKVEPYFDRVYLPSGMWDPMGASGQELLSGTTTPEAVSKKMGEEYTRLLDQIK